MWNDRNYSFSNLPSYLVGTIHLKVPHVISQDTVINITVKTPSTIYIAHEAGSRSGGFDNSLNRSEWILKNDNASIHYSDKNGTLKYVWKKVTSGPKKITLPRTTGQTVHTIFATGNSF